MLGVILDKQNIEHRITCYGSGEELLEADAIFHLVFLDIMMDGKNGIDVGREICRKNQKACIIYRTNFGEYITEAVNTVWLLWGVCPYVRFTAVLTSECPKSSCTSLGCVPFDNRFVVQVCISV